jgi:tetratricopeptide (TPR) repeat protein
MAAMLNGIQRVVFHFAACCVALSNAAVVQPVQALNAPRKTVLVLYGEPLSAPADRMTEQGLTAALSSVDASRLEVFTEYLDLMRFPAAQNKKDYDKAISDYTQAIGLDPNYANAFNYDKAISDYSEYIKLSPNEGDGYYWRGISYHRLGKNVEAQADFNKAKELGYTGPQ